MLGALNPGVTQPIHCFYQAAVFSKTRRAWRGSVGGEDQKPSLKESEYWPGGTQLLHECSFCSLPDYSLKNASVC